MPLVNWDDKMSVGVKAMDNDHKKLVGMLNELHQGVLSGDDQKTLGAVVERLIQYTKDHLAREEKLLAKYGFPDCHEHHQQHDQMIAKVLIAQANFRCGKADFLTAELMEFLKDWLTSHILESDKEYGPFMNQHGVF
jgi:hemerythrin